MIPSWLRLPLAWLGAREHRALAAAIRRSSEPSFGYPPPGRSHLKAVGTHTRAACSLLLLSSCALGYGRPGAPAGGLWVDATRALSNAEGLPPVYTRVDDEPPEPAPSLALGAHAGVRLGYGAGQFGRQPYASGLSYEPELELCVARPPFSVGLRGGYLVQRVDYAGRFTNAYAAPSVTLTVGWAPTAWLGLHVGGGALLAGELQAGTLGAPAAFGTASAWGGRALAGLDLALFRGRNVGLEVRLDLQFTQTGAGVIRGTEASMRHFGAAASLVWSLHRGAGR